jgi:hypothetical protein
MAADLQQVIDVGERAEAREIEKKPPEPGLLESFRDDAFFCFDAFFASKLFASMLSFGLKEALRFTRFFLDLRRSLLGMREIWRNYCLLVLRQGQKGKKDPDWRLNIGPSTVNLANKHKPPKPRKLGRPNIADL